MTGMSETEFKKPVVTNSFKAAIATVSGDGVTSGDVKITDVLSQSSRRELKIVINFEIKVTNVGTLLLVPPVGQPYSNPNHNPRNTADC